MMPTIRVDQDIYDFLQTRRERHETNCDVVRRLLEIPKKDKDGIETAMSPPEMAAATNLVELLDKYLPVHWADTPARMDQVLAVTIRVLTGPKNIPLREREISARKEVAKERRIAPETVLSKYGVQLFGGMLPQVERFRGALEKIELELGSRK